MRFAMKIHVCFSSDNNYVQHLSVAVHSVVASRKSGDELEIHILDGGISEENKTLLYNAVPQECADIHFVAIDEEKFRDAPIQTVQGTHSHVTLATYYRLLLPELLPHVDKVIYLDCDLVCRSSLAELYAQDMGTDWIRGVVDIDEKRHAERLGLERYVCAGVLLLNLKAWREEGVQEKCMAFIRDHADVIVLHDQDVLNVVCRDHLSYLDKTWDAQACETRQGRLSGFNDIARTANIIHFIGGRKPWHPGCRHPFRKEYFRYLRLTPYRDFVWEYRKAWLRYLLWHTRYSHGRRRWYLLGVRIWQKKD